MLIINNLATQDDYTRELTLESGFGGRLVYLVANASVIARFRPIPELVAGAGSKAAEYGAEQVLTPQSSFIDKISGVKFRSAVAGSPARVVATLSEPGDILPASGTPFTGTLAASGAVTGEVLAYAEWVAPVTLAAITEATATAIVTAPSVSVDGVQAILVEAMVPEMRNDAVGTQQGTLVLYEDGASIGLLSRTALDQNRTAPASPARRLVPPAGAHVYSLRGFSSVASAYRAMAGGGGSGNFVPGFIRITSA